MWRSSASSIFSLYQCDLHTHYFTVQQWPTVLQLKSNLKTMLVFIFAWPPPAVTALSCLNVFLLSWTDTFYPFDFSHCCPSSIFPLREELSGAGEGSWRMPCFCGLPGTFYVLSLCLVWHVLPHPFDLVNLFSLFKLLFKYHHLSEAGPTMLNIVPSQNIFSSLYFLELLPPKL